MNDFFVINIVKSVSCVACECKILYIALVYSSCCITNLKFVIDLFCETSSWCLFVLIVYFLAGLLETYDCDYFLITRIGK